MLLSRTSMTFGRVSSAYSYRNFTSVAPTSSPANSYKLLVCGGGAGGISVAAKFAEALGKGKVAIVEPADTHYYQPMWTLVGGGIKSLSQSAKPMSKVIPPKAEWIKSTVASFSPTSNSITLADGKEVKYEYLVVAVGIQCDFDGIKGLPEALTNDPSVCSNYSPIHVLKTRPAMERFASLAAQSDIDERKNAIFTFPATPIKCAGAPQKIMYLTDAYLRERGIRNQAKILFNTSLNVIFGAPKYAAALERIIVERDIHVNYRYNLVQVDSDKKEATFENLDNKQRKAFKYDFLHVVPPQSAPKCLSPLADTTGFVSVNKDTLQHVKYANIFAIGDCSNLPTSKTAAAVAGQNGVLGRNLLAVMKGKSPYAVYDGYTSCPLVTGFNKCILAEFDYSLQPLETFPFDQTKERRTMYYLKRDMMPRVYWNGLIKGVWNGPDFYRRLFHFGFATQQREKKK